ncbi:hypothetical protein [Nocardiopsis sp. FIRDI 009]|uniref:hypothetical protein n=1 Tax=Nocardiopsis sp. FIRDI 009 TaxID=714197 RepID=UPI000E27324A|nr:hypothetical protein [Nocardiopsis sp. FIRDI 009]
MDHTPEEGVVDDGQEQTDPDVIETVREQVIRRTCEWCGKELAPRARGRGRQRRYCSPAHRQRAYELRTAQERLERDQEAGTARRDDEPVREVVERTVTRTRVMRSPVQPPGLHHGDLYAPPEDPWEREPDAPGADPRPRELQRLLVRTAAAIAQGQMSVREVERIMRGVDAVKSAADRFHDQVRGNRH